MVEISASAASKAAPLGQAETVSKGGTYATEALNSSSLAGQSNPCQPSSLVFNLPTTWSGNKALTCTQPQPAISQHLSMGDGRLMLLSATVVLRQKQTPLATRSEGVGRTISSNPTNQTKAKQMTKHFDLAFLIYQNEIRPYIIPTTSLAATLYLKWYKTPLKDVPPFVVFGAGEKYFNERFNKHTVRSRFRPRAEQTPNFEERMREKLTAMSNAVEAYALRLETMKSRN